MVRRARLGVVILVGFTVGCGSGTTRPGSDGGSGGEGGGQTDAGPDLAADSAPDTDRDASGDAAACECRIEDDFTLTMSWACFCAKFGCSARQPACAQNRKTYPGCGLATDTVNTAGGPNVSVWDETGALVGSQFSSDTSYYQCPSDPSLEAGRVRAGRFPDATCAPVACTCTNGHTSCSVADAGADAGDAGGPDASCNGAPIPCVSGDPGGRCDDAGQPAVCKNGQWTCPPSTIPLSQCACSGAPPHFSCSCAPSGWWCPTDGGGQ